MYDSHVVDFHTIEEAIKHSSQADQLAAVGMPVGGQRLVLLIVDHLPGVAFLLKAELRAMNGDSRLSFNLQHQRVSRQFALYSCPQRNQMKLKGILETICQENGINLVFLGLATRWVEKNGHMRGVLVADIMHHHAVLSQRFTGQQIDQALAFVNRDHSLNIGSRQDYHVS